MPFPFPRLTWLCTLLLTGAAVAQEVTPAPSDRLLGVQPLGAASVSESPEGIPYSAIFDISRFPSSGFIRQQQFGVDPSIKAGEARGQARAGISARLSPNLPLIERGPAPRDAKLKLGPFYFDARSVTSGLLHSDNVNQTESNRQAGTIGVVEINDITAKLQWTENLRLSLRGDFIILPFEGKAGFNGFGIRDPLLLAGLNPELFSAQAAYDFVAGGWDMTLADSFTVEDERLRRNLAASMDQQSDQLAQAEFDQVDEAGRYSFGSGTRSRRDTTDQQLADRYGNNQGMRYDNTASLTGTRMLPADTRATVSLFRTDYWYSGSGNQAGGSRPDWRQGVTASLASERPTTRFKPYLLYTATEDSISQGFLQVARLGARGPITENMRIDANAGVAYTPEWDGIEPVYALTLTHQPRETTAHSIAYLRGVTGDDRRPGIRDWLTYRIMQGLGPSLRAVGSARWSKDRTNLGTDSGAATADTVNEEWGVGGGLDYQPGEKRLTLSLREIYTDSTLPGSEEKEWLSRLTARYQLRDRVSVSTSYEYTDLSSTAAGQSYYENLVRLWVTVQL